MVNVGPGFNPPFLTNQLLEGRLLLFGCPFLAGQEPAALDEQFSDRLTSTDAIQAAD